VRLPGKRRSGIAGATARNASLSEEQRSKIARNASGSVKESGGGLGFLGILIWELHVE